ncbi:MAG: tRNA (guanine(26)-N(2))-dimethyltransferase [Thermoplasmata archaeon]|nr:tRNA (guanine(26)-N(2))-dimethyltransferase [Thermoplasmata archaeon]
MSDPNLVRIREGTTELMVPQGFCMRGPGKSSKDVFYNRQMEFSRDISVLLGRIALEEGWRALDGLAASGARGLRMANECFSNGQFVLNDRNERAADLIHKNAELNDLTDVEVSCRDLRALLAEEHFDYIDVDPFGTPVAFIDSAIQSCRDDGIVAITATDTAPLSGTYPKTCARRYGALSARSPFSHETGLRILMGYVVREAAKHDRGCEPVLCFHADHYFRCHMRLRKGAGRADKSLTELGFATYDPKSLRREIAPERPTGDTRGVAGPLWCGRLHSSHILDDINLDSALGTSRRCEKMVGLWREELSATPLYYRVDELAQRTKHHPPKLLRLIESLRAIGASASPTHFDPKGVKTDMPLDELLATFEDISER